MKLEPREPAVPHPLDDPLTDDLDGAVAGLLTRAQPVRDADLDGSAIRSAGERTRARPTQAA